MNEKNQMLVKNIVTHLEKISMYWDGMNDKELVKIQKTVGACLINLQQIGELANKIDEQFKTTHGDIPWHNMCGMRNIIAHDYNGINVVGIWHTIIRQLPDLMRQLNELVPKTI